MKKSELKAITAKGEDSRLQFKQDIRNVDALASEMVAFSNSEGGRILIGVTDAGKLEGVPRADVGRSLTLWMTGMVACSPQQFTERW